MLILGRCQTNFYPKLFPTCSTNHIFLHGQVLTNYVPRLLKGVQQIIFQDYFQLFIKLLPKVISRCLTNFIPKLILRQVFNKSFRKIISRCLTNYFPKLISRCSKNHYSILFLGVQQIISQFNKLFPMLIFRCSTNHFPSLSQGIQQIVSQSYFQVIIILFPLLIWMYLIN